jgi:hypothetical protein
MDVASILSTFGIPLTIGGIIGLLIDAIIVTIVIIISDKIIAHGIEAKHAFIMAFASYFLAIILMLGLAFANIVLPSLLAVYIIPLLVWVVLGELLLKSADRKKRLEVAVVAFVIYTILTFVGVPAMLYSFIPF